MWAEFTDHSGPQCRKLPAKALWITNIALNSNSSGVNNVNKASSPSTGANVNKSSSTADDGIVNVIVIIIIIIKPLFKEGGT